MDGGHHSMYNPETIMHDLGGRGQAVGGAGCIGDHVMICRVVLIIVHAHHNGDVLILGWSRDDDLLSAAVFDVHIRAGFALGRVALGIRKDTGGLQSQYPRPGLSRVRQPDPSQQKL